MKCFRDWRTNGEQTDASAAFVPRPIVVHRNEFDLKKCIIQCNIFVVLGSRKT
jgi:hypothetical protein